MEDKSNNALGLIGAVIILGGIWFIVILFMVSTINGCQQSVNKQINKEKNGGIHSNQR